MLQNNNKLVKGVVMVRNNMDRFFQLMNCVPLVVMNLHLYVFRMNLCVLFTCFCCVLNFC